MTDILPPQDGRHIASATPNRCERWLEAEQQYVTLHCTRHANLPPGAVESPVEPEPTPEHALWLDQARELQKADVHIRSLERANRSLQSKLEAELAKAHEQYASLQRDFNSVLNARDTFQQDLSHMKRWCSEQLTRLHQEIVIESDKEEPNTTGVLALASQRKGIRMVLAELSRLENA